MGKIFYTSDLHFGHKNILQYENRPFEDVFDMERKLIDKWNSKVKASDDVYVLGDFAFPNSRYSIDHINDIVKKLNGKKHLILGNHDTWINKLDVKPKLWEEIVPYKEIIDKSDTIIMSGADLVNNRNIILCHYPIEHWNGQEHESIHLHRTFT